MPVNYGNLNDMHIDVLQEIGNIGTGNAVTALAKMLNKKVEMSCPIIKLVDFKDIANSVGGAETLVTGILVSITGDINGIMMFIVQQDSVYSLLKMLLGDMISDGFLEFSDLELSALQEIGNIMSSSYLSSLGGLINKKITPSIPYLAMDMANAILSVPAIEFSKVSDKVLFIESVFSAESMNVSGYFLLVPDMPSFNIIMAALGVE